MTAAFISSLWINRPRERPLNLARRFNAGSVYAAEIVSSRQRRVNNDALNSLVADATPRLYLLSIPALKRRAKFTAPRCGGCMHRLHLSTGYLLHSFDESINLLARVGFRHADENVVGTVGVGARERETAR